MSCIRSCSRRLVARARRLLPALFLGAMIGPATADAWDSNAHLWLNYVGTHPLGGGPWAMHLESQVRRAGMGREWQQLLLRTGVQYRVNDTVSLAAGYAFVQTHPYGGFPVAHTFPEHRAWEQVTVRTPILGLDFQHRVRLEQRFLGSARPGPEGWDHDYRYSNRFRYLLRTSFPLSADGAWYLPVWDEVFVNFGGDFRRNDFDQNRFFVGFGRRLGAHWRLETGFLEQTVRQRGGHVWEANHTLAVWLLSAAPLGD